MLTLLKEPVLDRRARAGDEGEDGEGRDELGESKDDGGRGGRGVLGEGAGLAPPNWSQNSTILYFYLPDPSIIRITKQPSN